MVTQPRYGGVQRLAFFVLFFINWTVAVPVGSSKTLKPLGL